MKGEVFCLLANLRHDLRRGSVGGMQGCQKACRGQNLVAVKIFVGEFGTGYARARTTESAFGHVGAAMGSVSRTYCAETNIVRPAASAGRTRFYLRRRCSNPLLILTTDLN